MHKPSKQTSRQMVTKRMTQPMCGLTKRSARAPVACAFVIHMMLAGLALVQHSTLAGAQDVDPHAQIKAAATASQSKTSERGAVEPNGIETVEADISTHSIEVTSGFSGTRIIIFGAVSSPFRPVPDGDIYDIIVAVEGVPQPLVARKKSNIFGLWINVGTLLFDSAPSYYTVASTRPIEEITNASILKRHKIGFANVKMVLSKPAAARFSPSQIADYKKAVIRLKRRSNLYQQQDQGVKFIGHSLFRSSFELPATIPVGPLKASIFLFRDGHLLARYQAHAKLRRAGLQRHLYNLAFNYPLLYGILAVIFAVVAGLSASAVFGRKQS